MRDRLSSAGVPYIIENVVGSPLKSTIVLCGSMFGLDVRRHRLFELGLFTAPQPACDHSMWTPRFRSSDTRMTNLMKVVPVYGSMNYAGDLKLRQCAMGIDWMPNRELTQAIPPAYTRFIGRHLMSHIQAVQCE